MTTQRAASSVSTRQIALVRAHGELEEERGPDTERPLAPEPAPDTERPPSDEATRRDVPALRQLLEPAPDTERPPPEASAPESSSGATPPKPGGNEQS